MYAGNYIGADFSGFTDTGAVVINKMMIFSSVFTE